MKEHLRDYFPQRFDNSDPANSLSLARKIFDLIETTHDKRSRANCERKVAFVFKESNELQLLAGAMRKYGCNFDLARHVSCERCKNCAGGFDPDVKQIIICYTDSLNENRIMSTMMHEMIHMFDYCRVKFDFNNLDHVACSEIRAANLTYCSILDKLRHGGSGMFDFKKAHQYCVKDMAFKSVKAYSPETDDDQIWSSIDKVFPGCYNDLEPFGRRPLSGLNNLKHSYRERFLYGYD